MRNTLKCILTLMSSAWFFVSYAQDYSLEDTCLNCYISAYQNQEVDLKELIYTLEQDLIEAEHLKDTSGESYVALLQKIVDNPSFTLPEALAFIVRDPYNKFDRETLENLYYCTEPINTSSVPWGRFLSEVDNDIADGQSHPEIPVIRLLLEKVSAADFDHLFYKMKAFHFIDMANDIWGGRELLPPMDKN